jgi:hypothetical protein
LGCVRLWASASGTKGVSGTWPGRKTRKALVLRPGQNPDPGFACLTVRMGVGLPGSVTRCLTGATTVVWWVVVALFAICPGPGRLCGAWPAGRV